eukprot:CAMPEP_0173393310 /NCGR_PEP_ID=MMETSP1356-20130122/22040_1 /TAXON_ID=77927 ORGANISM="Hemiselmis virescens, Strain PCC157" /NCGR_SAMPLE_ID=MMETSP1356 /ASSEMBLY_ACC=CAM_ASM_000847 /LENGTH=89 /DNA_ID=CAMNT_0014351313 /DNA_START=216 /DNA_END=481 /DNA_ORIENTATION=+
MTCASRSTPSSDMLRYADPPTIHVAPHVEGWSHTDSLTDAPSEARHDAAKARNTAASSGTAWAFIISTPAARREEPLCSPRAEDKRAFG